MAEEINTGREGADKPAPQSEATGPLPPKPRPRRRRASTFDASQAIQPDALRQAPGEGAAAAAGGAERPVTSAPVGRRRRIPLPQVSLPGMEATSNTLRAVILNFSFFVAFFLVLPALATQFWRNQVILEPISVPKPLVDMGMKPEVAANRIWDGLQDFAREAQTAKSTFAAVPEAQRFDFTLPEGGISLTAVVSQLRSFFNLYETRIGGEMLCATPACEPAGMRLRLRVIKDEATVIDLPPIGATSERDYFRQAAEGVFTALDPFVSIAALAETQPRRAVVLARQLVRTRHPDAKWAHNLIGEIDVRDGLYAEAAAEFEAALALDPGFVEARANYGVTLAHLRRYDEADAELIAAAGADPGSVEVAKARASVAFMRGDREAAVGHFLRAAELDPLNPQHLVLAGRTEMELGQKQTGEAHLKEALSVAPGDPEALNTLGAYYFGLYGDERNLAAALQIYRNWTEYDPQNPQAQFSLGNVLVSRSEFDKALEAYDRAMALGETGERIKVVRAGALMGLERDAEAIAAFEALTAADPPLPAVFLSLGKLYDRTGASNKALTAFRRFLEVAPPDHEQRTFAEGEVQRLAAAP